MNDEVNRYRNQWDGDKKDNFGSIMPIKIYRVVWKDSTDKFCELWTESYEAALSKKSEIDHSNGMFRYVNFEGWFAYRFDEHDKRFGSDLRERDWFETKPR